MSELEDYEAAQAAEYGEYVAKEQIFIGNALAFNVGDPVPKGHVTREVVSRSQVVKASTKAASDDKAATNPPKGA